ncbi:glycosyltransferase family 4 protein [Plantactinospora sp. CA-290183]|uniref:glycosyltransferase family 4 protein n=1 Tax=Plantactinospora sp. CA-290183 TaxID=3240006 RepID=UPI003D91EC88
MIVPPWYALPPPGYGGLEQVCSALVDALAAKGHEVTLFGAGTGTGTAATFVGTVPELQHQRVGQALPELAHLARVNRMVSPASYDIVHDHTTVGPYAAADRSVPTVATVHNRPSGELREILGDVDPSVGLVAISDTQRRLAPELPWAATVHNGISTATMMAKSSPGPGPVLWLARFSADKGPDLAIQACRDAGMPLVLAGKCDERPEQRYLEQVVEPMVGPDVTVLRNPDRDATVRLMLAARCLIMPIRWEEPFGMVMVEAMATGTPVVALNRGAVPELVRSGETGLICDEPAELAGALRQVSRIEPAACVAHVRRAFSAERMADDYERVYRERLAVPAPSGRNERAPSVAW